MYCSASVEAWALRDWAWLLPGQSRQPIDFLMQFVLVIGKRERLHDKRFLEWRGEARPLKNGGSSEAVKLLLSCWAIPKNPDHHGAPLDVRALLSNGIHQSRRADRACRSGWSNAPHGTLPI